MPDPELPTYTQALPELEGGSGHREGQGREGRLNPFGGGGRWSQSSNPPNSGFTSLQTSLTKHIPKYKIKTFQGSNHRGFILRGLF